MFTFNTLKKKNVETHKYNIIYILYEIQTI